MEEGGDGGGDHLHFDSSVHSKGRQRCRATSRAILSKKKKKIPSIEKKKSKQVILMKHKWIKNTCGVLKSLFIASKLQMTNNKTVRAAFQHATIYLV